jgi:choline kinase
MKGVVLAAGASRRLRPLTENIPKALLPASEGRSILDYTLSNFATVGITSVTIVVGYRAEAIASCLASLEARHDVGISLIHNDRAERWNNAYSLWCARQCLLAGALVANGDTLYHHSVASRLLQGPGPALTLAVDRSQAALGSEAMKVQSNEGGNVMRISKLLDPRTSDGEFIGVSRVDSGVAEELVHCLDETWHRDPHLFYEDGFQRMIDRGALVRSISTRDHPWIEVDTPSDLAEAQVIACRL